MDVLNGSKELSTLALAIKEAELESFVRSAHDITLFTPTNSAFSKLPMGKLNELLRDKTALKNVLLYHISKEKVKASDLRKNKEVKTLAGKTIAITNENGNLFLNESKVTQRDFRAKNGLIHVVDTVLFFDEETPNNTFVTEQDVDVERYMGLWYEYARYENSFQKNCLGTTAEYQLKNLPITGKTYVEVINTCEKSNGELQVGKAKAFIDDEETNARLKVSFVPVLNNFGLFAGDYNILKLGPGYEYALVGDRARTTFWILTREKEIPETLYEELLDIAVEKGFRRDLIKRSPVFTR